MNLLEIRTARLSLQVLGPESAARVARYYIDNALHLAPWEPARPPGFTSAEQCADRLRKSLDAYLAGAAVPLAMIDPDSETMIGSVNFSNIVRGVFQACHLGYAIDARHEGEGLMFEAVSAGIDYVFNHLGLHRVMANHLPENHRSAALLQRLGFEREGYAKSYLQIAGVWRDHVLNALINPAQR
ncbi:GNAT family N-acetyltransferase [Oxalobacteraceae bacterium OM1]|nr:GNAT family N-acetyltransferase [Oxalobacteraceae bacterium OM1]